MRDDARTRLKVVERGRVSARVLDAVEERMFVNTQTDANGHGLGDGEHIAEGQVVVANFGCKAVAQLVAKDDFVGIGHQQDCLAYARSQRRVVFVFMADEK